MKPIKTGIGHFLRQPKVTVCLGLLVFFCGLSEVLEEVIDVFDGGVGAEHGMLVFGIMTLLKGLTELAEGAELVTIEIEEVEREEAEDATAMNKSKTSDSISGNT